MSGILTKVTKTVKDLDLTQDRYFFRPYWRPMGEANGAMSPMMPSRVIIIGCGGNGGYLIPLVARYLSQSRLPEVQEIQLVLIDGDRIEPKNFARQNFVPKDNGENKAQIWADKCNSNLGMNVIAIPEYFTETVLEREMNTHHTLVIGCVDRHEVRQILSNWVTQHQRNVYIDVGNELSAGQMFISAWPLDRNVKDGGQYGQVNYAERPVLIHEFYPEISKADPKKAAPSCADLTAAGQQRMTTNVKAAGFLFEAFEALMVPTETPHYQITFGEYVTRTLWLRDLEVRNNRFVQKKG